ncbi:MAG: LysM peptidoglycan-binding domain-containing protein [Solirubrobacterales bacterium]
MDKKTSPISRILAIIALLAAVAIVFVVVSSNTGSDDTGETTNQSKSAKKQNEDKKSKSKAKTYEVKSGDTLTGIAADTGVSVDEIEALNPDLDPQALIAGQKLKLR